MKKQKTGMEGLSASEKELIEKLRAHPEMQERLQSILEITRHAEDPLKTADQVEELLVEEMRRLGNTSMQEWAKLAEKRVGQELKAQDATVRSHKKKR